MKKSIQISLTSNCWQWLDDMASKYKLSSTSKALRCCINCVALGDAQIIQPDTSCCGCTNIVTKEVELANEQFQWLEDQKTTGGGTKSIEQEVVNACMKIDEYTVFGVIRCKSSVAKCEGAQEAVENIQKQFGKEKGEVVTKENIDICAKDCGCD